MRAQISDFRLQIGLRLLVVAGLIAAPATAAQPVSKAKAEEIYNARCQKCHGPDGNAPQKGEGLSFADGEWNRGSSLKAIVQIITDGVPETGMKSFKDQLTPEEIAALAKLVRSFDKNLKK